MTPQLPEFSFLPPRPAYSAKSICATKRPICAIRWLPCAASQRNHSCYAPSNHLTRASTPSAATTPAYATRAAIAVTLRCCTLSSTAILSTNKLLVQGHTSPPAEGATKADPLARLDAHPKTFSGKAGALVVGPDSECGNAIRRTGSLEEMPNTSVRGLILKLKRFPEFVTRSAAT